MRKKSNGKKEIREKSVKKKSIDKDRAEFLRKIGSFYKKNYKYTLKIKIILKQVCLDLGIYISNAAIMGYGIFFFEANAAVMGYNINFFLS